MTSVGLFQSVRERLFRDDARIAMLGGGGGGGVDVDDLPAAGVSAQEEAAAVERAATGQVQVKRHECEVAELAHY